MRRRRYLALSGAAFAPGIAGCGSAETGVPENLTTDDEDTDTATARGVEPTDATATRTATPTDDGAAAAASPEEPSITFPSSNSPSTATATPSGTATQESTGTSEPEPTATATTESSTATPGPEPTTTAEPEPTATPAPEPTATPEPEPTSTPSAGGKRYTFSGSGDSVTDPFSVQGGFTSFDMAHDGASNFQVELVHTDSGDTREHLANEIGEWEGLLPYDVPGGEYVLDVTADGNWEIVVRQPRHTLADADSVPVEGDDEYPNYLGPVEFEGYHAASARYDGDDNVAVWLLDDEGDEVDLLFNEVGQFEGETTTNYEGLGYVRVEATGPWRIEIE